MLYELDMAKKCIQSFKLISFSFISQLKIPCVKWQSRQTNRIQFAFKSMFATPISSLHMGSRCQWHLVLFLISFVSRTAAHRVYPDLNYYNIFYTTSQTLILLHTKQFCVSGHALLGFDVILFPLPDITLQTLSKARDLFFWAKMGTKLYVGTFIPKTSFGTRGEESLVTCNTMHHILAAAGGMLCNGMHI